MCWIKAHVGLDGNERADAVGSKRKPNYDRCPVSFVKRLIRSKTFEVRKRRYTERDTAKRTQMFFPDAMTTYRTVGKLELTMVKTQVHGRFFG